METQPDIAAAISLAVAPILLLAGIGGILNVMTVRLGRVLDRARHLEHLIEQSGSKDEHIRHQGELRSLSTRIDAVNYAILTTSVSALLICLVVALLFVEKLFGLKADIFVAVLFLTTMTFLIVGLAFLLREITVATRSLKVRTDLLRDPPVS